MEEKKKYLSGEDRILVPSPKVATYDLKPEMSAYEVTDKLIEAIKQDKYDSIILNYENPDMVGHTGIQDAAIKAIETIDECVGKVVQAVIEKEGLILITADHGNSEQMIDYKTGEPHTAHTTNPVPIVLNLRKFDNPIFVILLFSSLISCKKCKHSCIANSSKSSLAICELKYIEEFL